MKWRKLGQIFNTEKVSLPLNCISHAQSPQAVELDDRIRVYFSTRERDKTGKFLSHIAFVDFDLSLQNILSLSQKTVIPLGKLGDFDEHGIFPVHIFPRNNEIWGFTTGWNRKVSVSADAAIGLTISRDGGETFQKMGKGPVLAASLFEPFLIGDPAVLEVDGTFHMWYIFGQRWVDFPESSEPERVYKIAHATSNDGIEWFRDSKPIIADVIDENECQALPTVLKMGSRWHMYFCFRHASGFRTDPSKSYRLGYAFSDDLVNWKRDDANAGISISEEGWDSEMMCYPQFFESQGNRYLLYNGNEFGKYGFGLAILEKD